MSESVPLFFHIDKRIKGEPHTARCRELTEKGGMRKKMRADRYLSRCNFFNARKRGRNYAGKGRLASIPIAAMCKCLAVERGIRCNAAAEAAHFIDNQSTLPACWFSGQVFFSKSSLTIGRK